ncbi:YvrJ family protein [Peptostreptococcus russellii]|nr:YvrJ family protein [Peptostreptococcus russellii]MBC2578478.1 YvrJ family protein [Peptostreptococcus russellii]
MELKSIVPVIQNVGFPITISIYLLIRMEKKIDQLTDSIRALSKILEAK